MFRFAHLPGLAVGRVALAAALSLSLCVPALARAEEPAKDKEPAKEAPAGEVAVAPKPKKPRVEVVFVLDTTGSMGGLIAGAKAKIWAITNQIAGAKPTPSLKVGLVAFKDRGDTYVTQVHDLSADIDAVHGKLMTFEASGGGDAPESVNQALDEAVNKVSWSQEKGVLKMIFLVGDAPPHMDYPDDAKYPETCKTACKKNIRINTVQCGNDTLCTTHWREIAAKAEGEYVQIAQDGGVLAVATPHDAELAALNAELARSAVVFGSREKQAAEARKFKEAGELDKAASAAAGPVAGGLGGRGAAKGAAVAGKPGDAAVPAAPAAPGAAPEAAARAAAADRAGFLAKSGRVGEGDLLDALKAGTVKLEELKDEELPESLRGMSKEDRAKWVKEQEAKRDELRKKILELDRKRADHIKQQLEKDGKAKDGFDGQVLKILEKQAKDADIKFEK
jgi:Mg-chelatase subunit ChlD